MFYNLYKKCLDLAAHKNSKCYFALISFVESSFSNTTSLMVIPMVISKKNDFIKIFIATILSVLDGMLGYLIGAFFRYGNANNEFLWL